MADRNPSKKRRQAQNEAARDARTSRAASARATSSESSSAVNDGKRGGIFSRAKAGAASGARPARTAAGVARATGTSTAPARPSRAAATKASSTKAAATPAKRGERTSPGSRAKAAVDPEEVVEYETPVATGRPLPAWLNRFGGTDVGAKWVFFGLLAALFGSAALCVFHLIPQVDPKTNKVIKGAPMVTALHSGVAKGMLSVSIAPLVVLAAILFARPGFRRRTWFIGLAVLAFLTLQFGSIYLAAVVGMALGCWQNRRAALIAVGGDPKVLREQDRARRVARPRRPLRAEVDSDDDVPDDDVPDDDA